jgi:hypothetical protein
MLYVTGGAEFRFFSPIMAYSACVYFVRLLTVYNVLRDLLPKIALQDDFVSSVLIWLPVCNALVCSVSPILMWLDSPKFSSYVNKWHQLQVGNYCVFIVIII